jgi:hypothetical protein
MSLQSVRFRIAQARTPAHLADSARARASRAGLVEEATVEEAPPRCLRAPPAGGRARVLFSAICRYPRASWAAQRSGRATLLAQCSLELLSTLQSNSTMPSA